MFALGSTEFIKKKFGSGYNLILHNKFIICFKENLINFYSNNTTNIQNQADEITTMIKRIIPSSIRQYETTLNNIQYVLPFSEQSKFSTLFAELEKINNIQVIFIFFFFN